MNEHHRDHADEPHDRGLAFDMTAVLERRRAIKLLAGAGAGLFALAACGSDDAAAPSTSAPSATAGTTATTGTASTTATTGTAASPTTAATAATSASDASCSPIPEETAGPFPGYGSNGVNVLSESGIVRSDIRSSFGDANRTAEGVPLTIALTVLDTENGCTPLAGAAVYLWHCDIDGNYSLYSQGVTDQNYLRGVQETDANGQVTYTSIFPGAYSGRWPHVHFEVYPSLAAATGAQNKVATSQLALPLDVCETVYATAGYERSVVSLAQISLESDIVFSDGADAQLATVSGSVDAGYVAELAVPI